MGPGMGTGPSSFALGARGMPYPSLPTRALSGKDENAGSVCPPSGDICILALILMASERLGPP